MWDRIDKLLDDADTSAEIEEMMKDRVDAFCPIKRGMCDEPWDCGECSHFQREHGKGSWACPSCRERGERTLPFYMATTCSRCGRFSILCSPLEQGVG